MSATGDNGLKRKNPSREGRGNTSGEVGTPGERGLSEHVRKYKLWVATAPPAEEERAEGGDWEKQA